MKLDISEYLSPSNSINYNNLKIIKPYIPHKSEYKLNLDSIFDIHNDFQTIFNVYYEYLSGLIEYHEIDKRNKELRIKNKGE